MKKTWVKRDNIYYKPFYKQKLKMALLLVLVMAVVFFGYQFFYISQLQSESVAAGGHKRTLELGNNHRLDSAGLVKVADTGGGGMHGSREVQPQRQQHQQQQQQQFGGSNGTGRDDAPIVSNRFAYVEKIGNYERKILRGIRLRDLDQYTERLNNPFRCLATGKEIGWHWVNDDYCDCPEDGSDEPSTSACANGHYYCRYQKRHQTGRGRDVSVPSGWVNDGICDCCDGSDEWLRSANCTNTCKDTYF